MSTCISGTLIKNIINDVSLYYLKEAYITSKAYIKNQNINDGQIDIMILVGKIENIIHKKTKESSSRIKTAFIFQKNEVLNLRDLETSLESINRVPLSDVVFKIIPGEKVGASIVQTETKKSFPIHLSFGISGVKSFNDNNPSLTAVLSLDNLLCKNK